MDEQKVEHRLTKVERDTEINIEIIKDQLSGIRIDLRRIEDRIEKRTTWLPVVIFGGLAVIVALIKLLP